MSKRGQVGQAALRSGMDRKNGRRYLATGRLPTEASPPRCWRTRPDPFEEDWPAIAERLEAAPTLEGRALFEDLLKRQPERYEILAADLPAPGQAVAGAEGPGQGGVLPPVAPARRGWTDGLHRRREVGRHHRRRAVSASAVSFRAAVLEFGVGDSGPLPFGVDAGAAAWRSVGGVPFGAGARVPPEEHGTAATH